MSARHVGVSALTVIFSVVLALSLTGASRRLPTNAAGGLHSARRCGWRVIPAPRVSSTERGHGAYRAGQYENETLVGVEAISAKNIWTIGQSIEHWNGSTWTVYRPVRSEKIQQLNAIAAASPTSIWVVGGDSYFGGGYGDALVNHWNGRSWKSVPVPQGNPLDSPEVDLLYAVAASPAHEVWAAGGSPVADGEDAAFAMRWNGHKWLGMFPSPRHGTPDELYGVAPVSPDVVLAVGDDYAGRWNGKQWTPLNDPYGANAVDGLSRTDAWSVGGGIEHWSGVEWSRVPFTLPAGWLPDLLSISAASADDVWAVGQMDHIVADRVARQRILVAHWNGTRWTRGSSPSLHAGFSDLTGVSMLHNGDAWAVGSYGKAYGKKLRPVIEHYTHCSS